MSVVSKAKNLATYVWNGPVFGRCPICETRTVFVKRGPWLRDQFQCFKCKSIPRNRALIHILQTRFPDWRELRIHESSPGGPLSNKLSSECRQYTPTHFFPNVPLGSVKDGFRCENLEHQTFDDRSFDLVVTSDVFEHILDPAPAFKEIARTLKPLGAHVFTMPWYWWKETLVRAAPDGGGGITHLCEPDFHGNPIDETGSLVIHEWGRDFCDFVYRSSGLTTTAILIENSGLGLKAEFNEVFISTKPVSAD
jgi:SAM-dependent methyltransferase